MRTLFILAAAYLLLCCEAKKSSITDFNVIEIEGCEYITAEYSFKYANNYSFSITHKGNCKNHKK